MYVCMYVCMNVCMYVCMSLVNVKWHHVSSHVKDAICSSCLRLSWPGKKQSRADFPFTEVWILYEIFPNALFEREIASAVLLAKPTQTQIALCMNNLYACMNNMYVCMYVCMYNVGENVLPCIYKYIYICAHMHAYIHTYIQTNTIIHTVAHTLASACVCLHVCICVCLCTYLYALTSLHITIFRVYECQAIYIYTYT
jgi:hypothetical protein